MGIVKHSTRLPIITLVLATAILGMILTYLPTTPPRIGAVATQSPLPTGTLFDHVVVIMMSDHGIGDICGGNPPPCNGSNTPYMDGLANTYGISQQYTSLITESEPNYFGILSASIYNCSKSNVTACYPAAGSIQALNLVDRFDTAGLTWKGYMESQTPTAGCDTTTHEPYQHEHNGFITFQDVASNSTRCNKIVLANPTSCGSVTDCTLINDLNSSSTPNFMWLTPNDCDNMHSASICTNGCSTAGSTCVAAGDIYLKSLVPSILNSKSFQTQRSALFITFDEGTGYCPLINSSSEDCLYSVWAGQLVKTNFFSSRLYNQYSLTKTIEYNWNLTALTTNDASATPMNEFFKSTGNTNPPPPGTYFDHVVIIMMENQGITDICGGSPPPCLGSNSPYMSGLANSFAIGAQYVALQNNSLPNYVGIIGGSTFGCTDTNCPSITAPNLIDRFEATGVTWKGYMENQTLAAGCVTTSNLPYVPRHNPFVWYQDITNSSTRCNKIILANPTGCGSITDCALITDLNSSSVPSFMFLTPNICNDMHGDPTCTNGCTAFGATTCIVDGDNYLKSLVPSILNSKSFTSQRSALFITFDEGNGYCPLNNTHEDCMYAVWAGPLAKTNFVTNHLFNHYSFTKTIEQNWNLTSLTTNDSTATAMTEFFATPAPTAPTGTYFDHVVVIMMENEGITNICGGNPPPCNGSNTPYMNSLANTYGISQQFLPLVETSEPNYYGILGASIYNCTNSGDPNCYPPTGSITAVNLVDRLVAAGVSWKAYMENQNLAAGCAIQGNQEPYQHEHNGFVSFQDITNNTARCNKIVLANPSTCPTGVNGFYSDCTLINDLNSSSVPNFMWLTPNDCNNMHSASVCTTDGCTTAGTSTCITDGDTYLSNLVPKILNSKAFRTQRSALLIMFDEGVGQACPLNNNSSEDCLYTVWAGPVAKTSFHSGTLYNGYSLTKTLEINWKLATITSNDATATSMAEFFKPDYSVSSSISGATLLAGGRASSLITVQGYANFNGTVTLNASSLPGGPGLSLNPTSLTLISGGGGNSTFQFNPSIAGNYTVTITGTSGTLSRNATMLFTVQDYSISANPASPKTNIGSTGSSAITITSLNHFTRTVSLLATGTTGLNTTITPSTIEGGAGTATLTFSAVTTGNYTAIVSSSSGNLTHTVMLTVQIVDFTISATAPPVVGAGVSATSTITIAAINHFSGTVSLTETAQAGLTCGSISPSSITGSGTATVSCSSTTPGNYTLTLTGTNGLLSHSVTVTFSIIDFTMSASPASATINAGTTANSTITITSLNHYTGVVSLSMSISPLTGLTCTFSPTTLILNATTQTGTSTLSCTGNGGSYTVTITGVSSGLSHTATFNVTVRDYMLTASPSSSTIIAGNTATSTVTLSAVSGFAGTVTLTATINPAGLSCTLAPTAITLGTSGTSTLSCGGSAGIYNVTITGTSSGIVHSDQVAITVQDFAMSANPAGLSEVPGGTTTSTLTLASLDGFSGQVTLSSTISASGFTLTLNPNKPTLSSGGTATSTLTVTAPNNAVPENYLITVKAVSGSITHTLTLLLSITSFTISLNPGSQTFTTGSTGTFTVVIGSVDSFNSTVTLTVQVPSKLAATLATSVVFVPAGGTVSTTLNVTSTAAGTYSLTVTGVSGKLTVKTPNISVVVGTGKDLELSANPIYIITQQSTNATSTITVASINGLSGTVTLKSAVSPAGPVVTLSTQSVILSSGGTATFTVNIKVSSSVPVGIYSITFTGTSGSSRTVIISLFVASQSPDFTLTAAPTAVDVTAGSSGSSLITVGGINGFSGMVNLSSSVSGLGLACSLSQQSIPGASGNSTLTCSGPPGSYNVTITGTSSNLSHAITVQFNVQDFTISTGPGLTIFPGQVGSTAINVTAIGEFAGTVSLSLVVSPGTGLSCSLNPTSITLNDTLTSGQTFLNCSGSIGNYSVTVTGNSGTLVHSTTLTFFVTDFSISATSPPPVTAGSPVGSTITISSLNGFNGTVGLTDVVPQGLSCGSLSKFTMSGSGTATVSCSSTIAGNYVLTITGTSGTQSHSTTVDFMFQDFGISAASQVATVNTPVITNITVTFLDGLTGTVNLNDTIPTGLTCGLINPNNVTNSGSASLSCSSGTVGTYVLTITGSTETLTHATTATFTITDFRVVASSPSPVTVGTSAASSVTISFLNGFTGNITITDIVPSGLTCSAISPSNLSVNGTTTIFCSSSATGNYTLTISGTSGTLSHSTTAVFTISDFSITTTSPSAVTVNTSATSTITVTFLNQFSGTVSLTDTVPAGLTCGAISPSSLVASGTATVSCSANVAGNYALMITGITGTLSHSTTVSFAITDFTISASSPGPVTVGASLTSIITVSAVNGFTGVVSLTDTVPAGLTCGAISPSGLTASGTATVSCSATLAGNYVLTITGTSGTLSHSATATFTVADFSVGATSPSGSPNASLASTVTVTFLNGFAGAVSLTDTVPAGLTCGAITPGGLNANGTATLTCGSATANVFQVTIIGTSGTLSHSTTATFTTTSDFIISAASPSAVTIGTSVTSTITVSAAGSFSATVSLTETVPAGLTCAAISPTSVAVPPTATATVLCSSTVAGNYVLTVTGTSGSLTHSTTATFIVTDFTVAATYPAAVTVGISASSTITVTAVNGFTGTVGLTDAVAGLTCGAISPTSVTNSGTATISCTATVAGNYVLTVTGTSGTLAHSATVTFTVTDFTISASSPAAVTVGTAAFSTITVGAVNGFTGVVSLTDTIPLGLSCGTISPTTVTNSGTATVSCNAASSGNYVLTVTGTSGSLSRSTGITFTVTDFTVTATPSASIPVGNTATSTITVAALNGFTGAVSLTDIVPAGLACGTISPTTMTSSGTATMPCSSTAVGNYTVTVTGTSGTLSRSANVTFTFNDFAIAATSPALAYVGASTTSTITITAINMFGGNVTLTDIVPSGLTCGTITPGSVPASGNATVSCMASTAGNYRLSVTGTSTPLVHNATVTLTFEDFTLTASPSSITVDNATRPASTIEVTGLNGFAGIVTLTTNSTLCTVSPTTITGSGMANLSCNSSTKSYALSVTGTSGSLSHTILVKVTVQTGSVGGIEIPVDKIGLLLQLLPAVALFLVLSASGVVAARSWNRRRERPKTGGIRSPG